MIIEYFGMNGNASYNEQTAHKVRACQEAELRGYICWSRLFQGTGKRGFWDESNSRWKGNYEKYPPLIRRCMRLRPEVEVVSQGDFNLAGDEQAGEGELFFDLLEGGLVGGDDQDSVIFGG